MNNTIGISITHTQAVVNLLATAALAAIEVGDTTVFDRETYLTEIEGIESSLTNHPDWDGIEPDLLNQASDLLADYEWLNGQSEYGGYREGYAVHLEWLNDILYIV